MLSANLLCVSVIDCEHDQPIMSRPSSTLQQGTETDNIAWPLVTVLRVCKLLQGSRQARVMANQPP